jgi:hypothetical protein
MLKKFYEFLLKESENSNTPLNQNIIQLAIYNLVNKSLVSKQKEFKLSLIHSFQNNEIYLKFKDRNIKFYNHDYNDDLIMNTIYQNNLKNIISDLDKTAILNFIKIFETETFEGFFENLIKYQKENNLEDMLKTLNQVNINTYPLGKLFKLSRDFNILKDNEYFDKTFFKSYVYDNIEKFHTKKFIEENLGIENKYNFSNFEESQENDGYLTQEELDELVFNIESNRNYYKIYKKYFEEIEIPEIKKDYLFKFKYVIENIDTIEKLMKDNPIIDSTIDKFIKNYPYFFYNKELNIYNDIISKEEFSSFINSYKTNFNDIEQVFLQPHNLSFNVRTENNTFLKYSTELYIPLAFGMSVKSFDNKNKLVELNNLVFMDLESTIDGKKPIYESMEQFFQYLEINNYSLNLTNLSINKKFDKLDSSSINDFDYIRNCLIEKVNKYSDKIIIVCEKSENYLLDYIHSSDLSTKEILKNLDYITSIKPKTNKEFEDVASYIKKNNNIKNDY